MTDLEKHARQRDDLHRGQASERILHPRQNLVGLAGEHAFAQRFGLPIDTELRAGGDRGIDFVLPTRHGPKTVDVKTTTWDGPRRRMLVEAGKLNAEIYVLAHYCEIAKRARLLGWQWRQVIKTYAPRDTGRGVVNHEIPEYALRHIDDLAEQVCEGV